MFDWTHRFVNRFCEGERKGERECKRRRGKKKRERRGKGRRVRKTRMRKERTILLALVNLDGLGLYQHCLI